MGIPYNTNLPPDLRVLKEEIEGYAREYGLDFYETIFEVLEGEDLNEVAAYGGFPTRYPHWSFGMAFEELKKGYDYGLSKIYEMVINNDPCYAYLMRCNHTLDQKLVMAHVYGHCLAPETLIETRDGIKAITDVRVEDEVLSHLGAYRPVRVCARRRFKGKIYCIWTEGNAEPTRITGEHPVYLFDVRTPPQRSLRPFERWEKLWTQAAKVRIGDLLVKSQSPVLVGTPQVGSDYIDVASGELLEEDRYLRVTNIETEDYDGYVYNFSVEEDESYSLAAGLVVHNCDFFKNNAYFAHTSRKMMDEMANHGVRLRRYTEKHGEDEVEAFIDRCMSIDDLIDIHSTAIRRREDVSRYDFKEHEDETLKLTRFKSKGYMEDYINPREVLKAEEEERKKLRDQAAKNFPERPEKDVLLFLIEHAPLKPWQRDVLSIIRDEAYYFAPQGQTKVINEGWACLGFDSIVLTDKGLLRIGELVNQRLPVFVSDGQSKRQVYDWAKFEDRETIWVRTRRGMEIEGSLTHRLMLPVGTWLRLDEVKVGDKVLVGGKTDLWAAEKVRLNWHPPKRITLTQVAASAGVDIETVIRYRAGVRGRHSGVLAPLVVAYEASIASKTFFDSSRKKVRIPRVLGEKLAAFLGYLTGDGHISVVKRSIGLTTGDEEQADRFVGLVRQLFQVTPRKKWDEGRWRVLFSSRKVQGFLQWLGLETGFAARRKKVPDVILRSPKPVVAAFLLRPSTIAMVTVEKPASF